MESEKSRARHPVRVVAQRTGLTPATLRAWERRYGVVDPARSDGGQRLYSDEDVERLRVLHALTEGGHAIRLLAGLETDEAKALLSEDRRSGAPLAAPAETEASVAEAMALTRALDGEGLGASLRRAGLSMGAVTFLDGVIGPFLTEVGEAWSRGEIGPAEEHLASATVDGVLGWLTDPALDAAVGPTLVVGTLSGESHRLGARMVAAAAAFEGWRVTYLGADLPGAEIARVARSLGAGAVAISVVGPATSQDAVGELQAVREGLPAAVAVFVGGRSGARLVDGDRPERITVLDGLPALREALRRRS